MDSEELQLRVYKERDLGVFVSANLRWDSHIYTITGQANKMLGLLKGTCPLLRNTAARRMLYLTLLRTQPYFVRKIWSPHTVKLRSRVESVQRRASAWILNYKHAESTCQKRLKSLTCALPRARERSVIWYSFSKHCFAALIWTSTPLSPFATTVAPDPVLIPASCSKTPFSKSNTFNAIYFNHLVKIWNNTCRVLPPTTFASLPSFKRNIGSMYKHLLETIFDIEMPC